MTSVKISITWHIVTVILSVEICFLMLADGFKMKSNRRSCICDGNCPWGAIQRKHQTENISRLLHSLPFPSHVSWFYSANGDIVHTKEESYLVATSYISLGIAICIPNNLFEMSTTNVCLSIYEVLWFYVWISIKVSEINKHGVRFYNEFWYE